MPDIDDSYAALAQGASTTGLAPTEIARLLERAAAAVRGTTTQERLDGLLVAAAIGGPDGIKTTTNFQKDPEVSVRRKAFEIGLAAREEGLPILREAITDPDPSLAIEALRRLALAADKAATTRARSALVSPSGEVRAAAAALLGRVAGPAVRMELLSLAKDPDPGVRAAASHALECIEGRREPPTAQPWWGRLDAAFTPTAQQSSPRPVSPTAPPTEDGLAAAARALRAVGSTEPVSEAGIRSLRALAPDTLAAVMRDTRFSKEAEIARGFAIAARWLERQDWVSTVRRLLGDVNPAVRAAAAEAFGVLGRGLAAFRPLENLLRDPSPAVRVAAARAVAHLAAALGRPELTKPRLSLLTDDAHETVRAAVNALLAPAPAPTPHPPKLPGPTQAAPETPTRSGAALTHEAPLAPKVVG